MLSLGCFVDAVIVEPAPPVIDDVAALTRHRLSGLRVALERHADGVDRRDHLPLGEDAHETPEADTTAVFVGRPILRSRAPWSGAGMRTSVRRVSARLSPCSTLRSPPSSS